MRRPRDLTIVIGVVLIVGVSGTIALGVFHGTWVGMIGGAIGAFAGVTVVMVYLYRTRPREDD